MIIFKNKKLEIPVGLGPNFQEGSAEIFNQNKTVDSSTFYQRVYPDPGYTGLGRVIVNPYALDSKIVDSSTELQIVTSDKDGLYRVVVKPYALDEKTVDSSTNPQVITSDEDGLRQVTINPYVLSPLEVDSSTAMQEITGQYGTVTVNPYTLQNKASEDVFTYVSSDSRGALVVVKPDNNYDALEYFQYRKATILGTKTFDASTGNQTYVTNTANTYVKGINKIVINGLDLDSCYTLAASI